MTQPPQPRFNTAGIVFITVSVGLLVLVLGTLVLGTLLRGFGGNSSTRSTTSYPNAGQVAPPYSGIVSEYNRMTTPQWEDYKQNVLLGAKVASWQGRVFDVGEKGGRTLLLLDADSTDLKPEWTIPIAASNKNNYNRKQLVELRGSTITQVTELEGKPVIALEGGEIVRDRD